MKDYNIIQTRNKIFSLITLIIFSFLASNETKEAFSEAWLQEKNHGIFITSVNFQSFIGTNEKGEFDKNIIINQTILNLYGEYGISKRFTIGTKIIGIDSQLNNKRRFFEKIQKRSLALDSFEIFLRFGVITKSDFIKLSIITKIATPSYYHKNTASYFSPNCWKYETGLELGLKFNDDNFMIFSINYHGNIKYQYDEIHAEFMFGHYFTDSILFMIRFQKYAYLIKNDSEINKNNKIKFSLFDFISKSGFAKINLSIAVPINNSTTFEFGAYSSIKSKITLTKDLDLKLYGVYMSIWYKF